MPLRYSTSTALETDAKDCPLAENSKRNQTGGGCRCVGHWEIRCQGLREIPEFRPVNLDATEVFREIHMSRQLISEIRSGSFANIRARTILLNFNPIMDRLSSYSFVGIGDTLMEIQMAGCGLRTFPVGTLTGMTELLYLHLWQNSIDKLPDRTFEGAENLRDLILWGNSIDELKELSFSGLRHLLRLDLDRNR